MTTDITDAASVDGMLETVTAELGPVDVLVNNSGTCFHRPALDVPDEEWRAVWDVNVDGLWRCSRVVGSVAKSKTSVAGRAISMLVVIGAIAYPPLVNSAA